jgi:protein-tyrosine phosphatase
MHMPGNDRFARRVELDGMLNMRDLGGIPIGDSGRIRRGLVFRSETLQEMSPGDIAWTVERLRIRYVIDLRWPDEIEGDSSVPVLGSEVGYSNLPVGRNTIEALMLSTSGSESAGRYHVWLRSSVAEIVDVFRLMADERNLPVIFHCAAGKDRTGMIAAMMLDLLGVTPALIVDDYLMSASTAPEVLTKLLRHEPYRRTLDRVAAAVDERSIASVLDHLRADWGGTAQWLLAHGLTDGQLSALRDMLTENEGGNSCVS